MSDPEIPILHWTFCRNNNRHRPKVCLLLVHLISAMQIANMWKLKLPDFLNSDTVHHAQIQVMRHRYSRGMWKICDGKWQLKLSAERLMGHLKNIHLHSCKYKTVKLKLTLTLTLTLGNRYGAVLTLMLGYRRLRNYKLKRKIQIWDCGNIRGVYS